MKNKYPQFLDNTWYLYLEVETDVGEVLGCFPSLKKKVHISFKLTLLQIHEVLLCLICYCNEVRKSFST